MLHANSTRSSLLSRIKDPTDHGAWSEFVDHYGPAIYRWCRARGEQQADAEDVTQDVLCRLAKNIRHFDYDPSEGPFRGWLCKLTYRTWADFCRNRRRHENTMHGLLDDEESANGVAQALMHLFEKEILELAEQRVCIRVEPQTWRVYEELKQGLKPSEIAQKLRMNAPTVYQARYRVVGLLRDEIARIDGSRPNGKSDD